MGLGNHEKGERLTCARQVGLELPDFLGRLSKEMHEKKPPTAPAAKSEKGG